MMNRRFIQRFIVSLVVMLMISPLARTFPSHAQPAEISQKIQQLLHSVKIKDTKEPRGITSQSPFYALGKGGYLIHLSAPPSHYFPVTNVVPGNPTETAWNFLKQHKEILGATSPFVDFKPSKSKTQKTRHYESFEQTYEGIPVYDGRVLVQLNTSGGVEYMLSDMALDTQELDKGTLSTKPVITAHEAVKLALDYFSEKHKEGKIEITTPELNIYDPEIIGNTGGLRLVWVTEVSSPDDLSFDKKVLLDAHTGEIVLEIPLVYPALSRTVHDQANTRTFPVNPARSDTVNPPGPNPTGIAEVDNAYDFLGDSYNFYWNNHGRDARDGSGGTLLATVRWCSVDPKEGCPYWNALGGLHMKFGDGFASCDDVVGHEYTHYITYIESKLAYMNQSGAINESFSDIWGEFIDLTNGRGMDTPLVRWLMMEDHTRTSEWVAGDQAESGVQCGNGVDNDGDGLIDEGCPGSCHDGIDNDNNGSIDLLDTDCFERDMQDPPRKNQPDRMSNFVGCAGQPPSDPNDQCWVHTNSGIGNKLAYLLTDGDTFNGLSTWGMGISAVADLFYEVQTGTLYNTPGATYYDLYYALRQSSINLGWSGSAMNNLLRACRAVEIAGGGYDVYVSTTGSDTTGDGSSSNPYRTVWKAHAMAIPGDRLLIQEGTYSETLVLDKIIQLVPYNGAVVIGQ